MNEQEQVSANEAASAQSALNVGLGVKHNLYITGDKDAPEAIKDRNGEVALQLCKICRKAERELQDSTCTPYPKPGKY